MGLSVVSRVGGAMMLSGAVAAASLPAGAQSLQSPGGMAGGLLGGGGGQSGALGGLIGRGVPSVSSAPTGNLAGALGYCVQNNAMPDNGGASSILNALSSRGGVTGSAGYAQGQRGILQSGTGGGVSLGGMQPTVRSKVCEMVMNRARSML